MGRQTRSTLFTDESDASGLAAVDLPFTGFGCGFFDFDNHSDLDLAVVNGAVRRMSVQEGEIAAFWDRYAEPNLLFQNDGHGMFTDARPLGGAFTSRVEMSRDLAFGDIDLVVGNLSESPRVFRNDAPLHGTHWLLVRALIGNRDAIGAEVAVVAGDRRIMRLVLPGYSYVCSNDPRAHFGLGSINIIDGIEVTWPDQMRERFSVPGVDRQVVLRKGEGKSL